VGAAGARAYDREVLRRAWPVVALLVAVAPSHAQPVLHEYVPEVTSDESELLVSGGARGEAAALVYEGEVLPPPEGGAARSDEQPLAATPPGAAGASFRPDRLTELEDTLGYFAVFTPSVAPFKRVTALDAVRLDRDGRTPVLAVHPGAVRALRVEGAQVAPPDARPRDRFWGSVVLDFSEGARVPLPSVSPESRILTARTEPEVSLRFEKDGADAYFAVAVGPRPRQPVRLVFLTDAPRPYFNAPVPDVATDTLAHEVHPLPADVRARAVAFAAELGVRPSDPLAHALDVLVGHFRSFEESSSPPADGGDIYLDLARAKKGVCRHRTYAFVITAQALGIPARFVYNEAHAWAEVKLPGVGFLRVDLGGAARALEAHGAQDRPLHRPRGDDPFPRPSAYDQGYSQLAGDVTGFRAEPRGDRGPGSSGASAPASTGTRRAASSPTADRGLVPLRVMVDQGRYEAYRGRSLQVAGRVTDPEGRGVPGLRIEVLLRLEGERLLGVTVSGDGGAFQGAFGVPPHLPVGDYELVVRTPGDDVHAPGVAY
jgi:hypothetical protein